MNTSCATEDGRDSRGLPNSIFQSVTGTWLGLNTSCATEDGLDPLVFLPFGLEFWRFGPCFGGLASCFGRLA